MITEKQLKDVLNYNPETGIFTWLTRPSNSIHIGDIAGGLHHTGYIHIRINGKKYSAHRLAWLYTQGQWPKDQIDHINGIKDNNKLSNLREATSSQNNANSNMRCSNKSGRKGVYWHKGKGMWAAQITTNSKVKRLGTFTCKDKAYAAYCKAADKYHGKFANYGVSV